MFKVRVYLWFDIEDYVTKESHDLPLIAFRILTKYNVPVTCKLVAEKVRALKESGRDDVISAIAQHDVGYHLDTHSRHPTMYEYLADLDVDNGAKEFYARENSGLEYVKNVFARNVSCFGHCGPTWAPHVYPALGDMEIPVYLDETKILNLENEPYWYCGVLNLNGANHNFINFDYSFESPNGNAKMKKQFDSIYKRLQKQDGGTVSILWHLHTAINTKFWDEINFSDGQNRPREQYQRPRPQPPEITERAWRNFEELIRYVSSFEDVQFITARDAQKIYGKTNVTVIDVTMLKHVTKHFRNSMHYLSLKKTCISPSQGFYAVTKALAEYESGRIPDQIKLMDPLGPMKLIRTRCKTPPLSSDFVKAARSALQFVEERKRLPPSIRVGDSAELSPNDFLATACRLLRQAMSGKPFPKKVRVSRTKPPQLEYIDASNFRDACKWKVLPRGFKAPRILEQIKLQAWTLRPAVASAEYD